MHFPALLWKQSEQLWNHYYLKAFLRLYKGKETLQYSVEQWKYLPKPVLPNVASIVPNSTVAMLRRLKTLRMASVSQVESTIVSAEEW